MSVLRTVAGGLPVPSARAGRSAMERDL